MAPDPPRGPAGDRPPGEPGAMGAPRTIEELGEIGLIERIRARTGAAGGSTRIGIGDDAAVVAAPPDGSLLVSTDAYLEWVHFRTDFSTPRAIGRKAAIGTLADIAAMGGSPRQLFLALGVPAKAQVAFLDELLEGVIGVAEGCGATLAGGDTILCPDRLLLALTAIGSAPPGGPILRSGARPGDALFVTGTLGGSLAGLMLLQSGTRRMRRMTLEEVGPGAVGPPRASGARGEGGGAGGAVPNPGEGARAADGEPGAGSERTRDMERALERHREPPLRLAEASALVRLLPPTAMIDVSDGLASEAGHLARASGVGFRIEASRIPVHPGARAVAALLDGNSLDLALSGGEEHELLFTAPAARADEIERALLSETGTPATRIGVATAEPGLRLVQPDGALAPLEPLGFRHF